MKVSKKLILAFFAMATLLIATPSANATGTSSGNCATNKIDVTKYTSSGGDYPIGELIFPAGEVSTATVTVRVINNVGQVPNPYHKNNIVIDGVSYPIERDYQPNDHLFSFQLNNVRSTIPISVFTEDGWSARIKVYAVCTMAPPAPEPTVPPTTVTPAPEPTVPPTTVVVTPAPEPTVPPTTVVAIPAPEPTVPPTVATAIPPVAPAPPVPVLPATGGNTTITWLAAFVLSLGAIVVYGARRRKDPELKVITTES